MMISVAFFLLQGLLLMAISPLIFGIEQWLAAWMQGRTRAFRFLLQPYRDLWKLANITPARPQTASWFFAAVPMMVLAISVCLMFSLPIGNGFSLLAMDPILLVYLLALHRFLLSLAGLDGEQPFGGLGAARTMYFNFISEINFFLFIIAMTLFWQASQPESTRSGLSAWIAAHQTLGWGIALQPQLLLLGIVLGILILYELERIPVGDPATHLELSMGEKGVTLAWQGRDLALVKLAEHLRLGFFLILFGDLFLPGGWPVPVAWLQTPLFSWLLFPVKLLIAILGMAIITNPRAKLRLGRVAGPAFFAGALSLLSIVFTISFHLYFQAGSP